MCFSARLDATGWEIPLSTTRQVTSSKRLNVRVVESYNVDRRNRNPISQQQETTAQRREQFDRSIL